MEEEKVLDKEQWKVEVAAVVEDVKTHVKMIHVSDLDVTDDFIYINITTIEGDDFCIQMSRNGFMIVGNQHNSSNLKSEEYFETPYALLDSISPKYRESFAFKLIESLSELKKASDGTGGS